MRDETEVVIAGLIGVAVFAGLLWFKGLLERPEPKPAPVKTLQEMVGPDLSKRPEGMPTFDYMTRTENDNDEGKQSVSDDAVRAGRDPGNDPDDGRDRARDEVHAP